MSEIKIGAYVKFKNVNDNGSRGVVTGIHPAIQNYWYVEWAYGRDVNGDVMTAVSGVQTHDLEIITKAEYESIRDRKGWSKE